MLRWAVFALVLHVFAPLRPYFWPRLYAVEARVLDARQPYRRHQVVMRAHGERPVLVVRVLRHLDPVVLQFLHHGFRFRIAWWQLQQRRGHFRPGLQPRGKKSLSPPPPPAPADPPPKTGATN